MAVDLCGDVSTGIYKSIERMTWENSKHVKIVEDLERPKFAKNIFTKTITEYHETNLL